MSQQTTDMTTAGEPHVLTDSELVAELEQGAWACADETTFAADGSYEPQFDDYLGLDDAHATTETD